MVEYWNVDLSKKVTHLLSSLSRAILPILHLVQDKFTHCSIFPPSHCELVLNKVKEDKITHYSIIPVFQLSAKRTKFIHSVSSCYTDNVSTSLNDISGTAGSLDLVNII